MKQLNLRDNKDDKKEQKENDIAKDKTEHAINTEKEIGIVKNKTEHTINTEKEIDIVKDKQNIRSIQKKNLKTKK